ncbi:MAG: MMPL family transporter [Bermanella sp.]
MNNRWFINMIRFRWLVVTGALLVAIAAGWGASSLEMKSDYREFFSESDPNRAAFNRIQETYSQSDAVLFVVAPKDGVIFQGSVLQMIEALTNDAWQLPYSLRIDSLTNFQHTSADEEGLLVADLIEDAMSLNSSDIAHKKQIALNEKMLAGRLITDAANVSGVAATINFPGLSNDEFGEVAQAARVLAQEYRLKYPDIDIYLSGMVMGNSATTEVIEQDGQSLMPLMMAIILFTLFLLMRSMLATLATLLIILFTLISAIGLMGWLGYSVTGPSSAAPIIILTMAVADCVHILVSYFFLMQKKYKKEDAIIESLSNNLGPIFLTSLTTAIGFLSMNFSDSPPFQILGTVSAIGVALAFLFSISLLPALMAILPIRHKEKSQQGRPYLDRLANVVIHYPRRAFFGMTLISLMLFTAIPSNEVNDQFTDFFDESIEFKKAVNFSNEYLFGLSSLEYALISPHQAGINHPDFLRDLDRFSQWLITLPEVRQVTSLSDTMKRLNRDMHAGDENWYSIPSNNELAAQYLLLYEMSLPFGLDMTNQIDFDKKETRVVIILDELSTKEILALESRVNHWLETQLKDIQYYDSSGALMFAHISVDNSYSSFISTMLALAIISLILAFALRSIKMGLVSIIVNILPAALAFGVWGILVGQVGISIATSVGMTLGIVVDNTVHFLSKYLHARQQGLNSQAAIRYVFSHVGNALLVCNAVLIAGFLVLSQSNLIMNRDMGLFAVLTFTLALLVDFVLLPTILLWVDRHQTKPASIEKENCHEPTALVAEQNQPKLMTGK